MNDLVALDMADDPECTRAEIVKLRKSIIDSWSRTLYRPLLIEIGKRLKEMLDAGEIKADDPIVVKR